ncbi:pyridoxal 5'-phosphate synthase [Pseudomonas sp. App30]|uniref:pyridoxal 5'-phosphate synthase n=1 Tax=Pseudomonas sp. App30 TaxID=3068990 RepID=UPI003A805691
MMNSAAPSIFDATPQHPVQAIHAWLAQAKAAEVIEPTAVAFATANAQGIASNRIVQILDVSAAGLVFATHVNSPKGADLQATGWASCVFHWPQVQRQVIVSGPVEALGAGQSDALWAARPPQSHAMSVVSTQSAPLADEQALREQALAAGALGGLARPPKWAGFILRPHLVEFWQFAPDRLYKRLKYEWAQGQWTASRLQP